MRSRILLAGLMAVLVATPAAPSMAGVPKYVLVETARPVADTRTVHVLVGQEELKSDINPSQVVVATGGGLLGALIDAGINAERAKKAEAAIQPLRAAMTGFDVDELAQASAKAAVEKLPWFQPGQMSFGRDVSQPGRIAVLDASQTAQVAFIEYVYDISPDFKGIRVSMTIQLANRVAPPKKSPAWRLGSGLVYSQTVTSVVELSNAAGDVDGNVAIWSADGAAKAKAALALAFQNVAVLAPRAFELTQAEVKRLNSKPFKTKTVSSFFGREIEADDSHILLFNGGFIHIQKI